MARDLTGHVSDESSEVQVGAPGGREFRLFVAWVDSSSCTKRTEHYKHLSTGD